MTKKQLKEDIILVYADLLTIRKSMKKNNKDARFNLDILLLEDSMTKFDDILYDIIEREEE